MSDILRTLKNGYWDRTVVVRRDDGGLRVRKESVQTDTPGPWAHEALRREIAFLSSLPERLRPHFPPLLASWDDDTIGYEMPFYEDRASIHDTMLSGHLDQQTADEMQRQLAGVVVDGLHQSGEQPGMEFAAHLEAVLAESIDSLADHDRFVPLTDADQVVINGRRLPGLRAALDLLRSDRVLEALAAAPSVLLHGDLILENILWPPLLLIDPVSVAALDHAHPLFDLVKYESFASGELYAIREELVTAGPASGGYVFEIPWDCRGLEPFRRLDLTSVFHARYLRTHQRIDPRLYALIDAYFSLVMARNTTGVHQWARVLKACQCLEQAALPA